MTTEEGFPILEMVSEEERLQKSKRIIDHFLQCPESEADETILAMKPFLKSDEYKILKKYYKEQKKGKIEEEITDLDEINVSAEMRENATRKAKEIMKMEIR